MCRAVREVIDEEVAKELAEKMPIALEKAVAEEMAVRLPEAVSEAVSEAVIETRRNQLVELVKENLLSIEIAAKKANLSMAEFQKLVTA